MAQTLGRQPAFGCIAKCLVGLRTEPKLKALIDTARYSFLCLCVQVRLALEVVFEGAAGSASPDLGCVTGSPDGNVLRVCDVITLTHTPSASAGAPAKLTLEWEAGNLADTVADAVVAVVMQVRKPPCCCPMVVCTVLTHADTEA